MGNLRDLLKSNIVSVTFTKKNGDKRVMKCTQMSDRVPEVKQTRNTPDDLLVVFDLEKEGWRSFYEDSVTDYVVVQGE